MASGRKNVVYMVECAVKAPLSEAGYDLWDLEYTKEGNERYLRITIDAPGGVSLDDCERAYRLIDPIVTQLDPSESAYQLEVSSPGLERELRTVAHYKACIGQSVRLKLFTAVNGKKELIGQLQAVEENGAVTVCCPEEYRLEKSMISKANIYFDFDFEDAELLFGDAASEVVQDDDEQKDEQEE